MTFWIIADEGIPAGWKTTGPIGILRGGKEAELQPGFHCVRNSMQPASCFPLPGLLLWCFLSRNLMLSYRPPLCVSWKLIGCEIEGKKGKNN